jgi:hypothetical protein
VTKVQVPFCQEKEKEVEKGRKEVRDRQEAERGVKGVGGRQRTGVNQREAGWWGKEHTSRMCPK